MSAIITPSRADLLSVHDPHFGPLQPSAMPPPPTSTSQSNGAFAMPSKLDRSKSEVITTSNKGFDAIANWRKGVDGGGVGPREVLGQVNVNSNAIVPAVLSAPRNTTSRLHSSASIPRPAPTPDVFAPLPTPPAHSLSKHASLAKRTRDNVPVAFASTSKRARLGEKDGNAIAAAEASRASLRAEEEKWRAKWLKFFPTLVFHFELGAEEGQGKVLLQKIMKLNGKVDQFFSQRITHLIVKGGNSPQKPRMAPPPRKADLARESPKNPFLDGIGATDLATKAEAMGIKVWTIKKLGEMLSRLMPSQLVATDSLHTLLEDEKLHGTRERDLSAPRPDYYYFKPGNKYLLIEDATNRHRPIMVKEYNTANKDGPEWPTLYDGFLRISAANQTHISVEDIRKRAWALYVERKPFKGEQPPGELRRSTSMRALPGTPKLPDPTPWQNASGNSVVITSNIASTSTANHSPALPGGVPPLGANKDRAIMQMSKRVQVLKGNARLAAAQHGRRVDLESFSEGIRRASTGGATCQPSYPQKTFMTQDQVIKMLRQARAPADDSKVTVEERIRNREKVEAGLKGREQDTAPGYCENCRLRYNDLSVHMASKKHRRFATNEENFEELDKLLFMLQRPTNPILMDTDFPPCHRRHGKDDPCDLCNGNFGSDGYGDEEGESGMSQESQEMASEEDDGPGEDEEDEDEGDEGNEQHETEDDMEEDENVKRD